MHTESISETYIVNNEPEIDPVYVDGVPEELLDNQWVNWRYELRDGKPTKVPLSTSRTHASHNNPSTWGSWEKVYKNAEANTGSLGIGRVLSANDPYFMLDLDDAYYYETWYDNGMVYESGEGVKEWARQWVEFADAYGLYVEVSPSGTGLKIIGKGTLPGRGRRQKVYDEHGNEIGEFELYDRLRFTTITGNSFTTHKTVGDGQDLID